jgi:hypothetical protein
MSVCGRDRCDHITIVHSNGAKECIKCHRLWVIDEPGMRAVYQGPYYDRMVTWVTWDKIVQD